MEPSACCSRLRTSTSVARSPRSSISCRVLASMSLRCITGSLSVLGVHEYTRLPYAPRGTVLRSQQRPYHPQERSRGHHQVDRDPEPLQHHERDGRDHQREHVEPAQGDALGKQHLRGEVDRQVRDDADHGRRYPDEDGPEPPVVGQKLYVRCEEEDEQKARQERGVGGYQSPQRPVEQRIERSRVVPGTDEPYVLGDHDQRSRRRLGQPQALHHLVRGEPPVVVDRHVGHIAEDRVGPPEGQEGRPREEEGLLDQHVLPAPPQVERPNRQSPQQDEDPQEPEVAQHRARAVRGRPVDGRLLLFFLRRAVSPAREGVPGEARAAQQQPGHGGGQDDQREGDGEEVEGHESQNSESHENAVVDGALADPQHRLYHDGYHHRLYAIKKTRDRGHVGVGHGQVREQPQHEDGGYDEEGAGHYPNHRTVQPPPYVGRDLLRLGTGQHHAEVERPQILALGDPTFPIHQLAVHDGDLSRRPPEVDEPELYPEPERLPKPDRFCFPSCYLLVLQVISTFLVKNPG